jgi:hypothetical protein
MQVNCNLFLFIKYIFFTLPLGLNKQFFSVLQYFVGIWVKMEDQGQVRAVNQKSKK